MAGYQDRVAARIRAERKSRGLSREEAARVAGISFRQYQRWETGQSEPRDANLRALAEAWGIAVDDLRPPDAEHEEREVRDQLDRIERKLDAVISAVGADGTAADLGQVVQPIVEHAQAAEQERARPERAGRERRRAAPGR